MPDGCWVGADASNSWVYDTAGDVSTLAQVGIGTAAATNPLDIYSANDSSLLRIHGNATAIGGLYGYSGNASAGYFSTGAEKVAGSWIARSTSAALFGSDAGAGIAFSIYANTGLTSGNAFGPTLLVAILTGGNVGIGVVAPATCLDIGAGAMTIAEMAAPGGGAANTCRLYCVDVGGKTALYAVFNTGVAQQIAIEP